MRRGLLSLSFVLALTLAGCCEDDADCTDGLVCRQYQCVSAAEQQEQALEGDVAPPPESIRHILFQQELTTCDHENQYGVCRLSFLEEGRGQLLKKYVYGPFNRMPGDPDCGVVGEKNRHPLIHPNRRQIIPNEATARLQYGAGTLDQIERCSVEENNCTGFENYAGRDQNVPICKINISTNTDLYTRTFLKDATYVLAAEKEDGIWIQDTFRFQAEEPLLHNVVFGINSNEPKFTVALSYQYAGLVEVQGCPPENFVNPPMNEDGFLSESQAPLQVQCDLNTSRSNIVIWYSGVDPTDQKQKRFEMTLEPPTGMREMEANTPAAVIETRPEEDPFANIDCAVGNSPHCAGTADLFWSVIRHARVWERNDQREGIDLQLIYHIPWVPQVSLYARDNLAPYNPQGVWIDLGSVRMGDFFVRNGNVWAENRIFREVQRTHQYTDYKLKIFDFNGMEYWSPEFKLQYPAEFSQSVVRQCVATAGGGGQRDTRVDFRWSGRHVKEIQILNCPQGVIFYGRPNTNDYNPQSGTVRINFGRGNACLQQQNRPDRCTIRAYDYELLHSREVNGQRVASPEWQVIPLNWRCCP